MEDSSVVARVFASCLALVALAGCGGGSAAKEGAPPGPKLTGAVAQRLDARFREMVEDTGVPGASAAILYPDGRMWKAAVGAAVLRPRQAMTSQTAFPLDSVTKVATAALAMRLVEQHRLTLDDRISKWYPAWRGDPQATVRDLLGHTSGIGDPPERYFTGVDHGRPIGRRAFVAAAGKPGPRTSDAVYSNAGFMLAGIILERAGGEPVASAMRREVLDHPGGDGLALQPAERAGAPVAHSYWYPRGIGHPVDANDGSPFLPSKAWTVTANTAGALAGDAPSLARWGQELFDGHVLQPGSLREMATFHPGEFWDGYGLGLAKIMFENHVMWGHTGDGLGSHTEFWHLTKENITIAVSWNDAAIDSDGGIFEALVQEVT
jgi:D-alanyl-D-alanine carboxypeptidase